MRTLHVGLQVTDLERSLAFYTGLGYEVLGKVPETRFGSLTMLQLPGDPFVSLELVHDPARPVTDIGGVNHLVVPVDDLRALIPRAAPRGPPGRAADRPGAGHADVVAHRPRRIPDRARAVATRPPR